VILLDNREISGRIEIAEQRINPPGIGLEGRKEKGNHE